MGRNTPILKSIVEAISDQVFDKATALRELEEHHHNHLLVNAGDIDAVAEYAKRLRLRVTSEEYHAVLDYIGQKKMVAITIDHVEQAINELLGEDRFIEPEQ